MAVAPFDLNLRHLRALAAIVARGSMSAAADEVGLSQPALTQGLAKLERQLGATLFERRFDGVRPTGEGLNLAARADAAFGHLAAARVTRSARGFTRPERLMTATQLRAFLALADSGSFVEAARATSLSQPALHRAVRDLEQLSATVLAERRGRGLMLTEQGKRLARAARIARAELAAGIAETSHEAAESTVIAVGAMPLCRAELLPRAIVAFLADQPRATIDVIEGSWRELIDQLRDGAIDLAIGALRQEVPADLTQRPLFDDRLRVIGRAGHPLADQVEPDLEAFARFPWIVGRIDSPLRSHWEVLFAGHALPPAPVECGSAMAIRGILERSDALTLLSPMQLAPELAGGTLTIIVPNFVAGTRTIGLTIRADWRPTPSQQRFLDCLDDVAAIIGIPENQ